MTGTLASFISLAAIFAITISIGWFIAVICIFQKYEPDKKICFVSDIIKVTFTTLTLWFSGSLFISLILLQTHITRSASLSEQLLPLSVYSDELRRYVPPFNDSQRLAEYNEVIADWFSNIRVSPNSGENMNGFMVIISGTPAAPMWNRCFLEMSSADPDSLLDKFISPRNYEVVRCDAEWG